MDVTTSSYFPGLSLWKNNVKIQLDPLCLWLNKIKQSRVGVIVVIKSEGQVSWGYEKAKFLMLLVQDCMLYVHDCMLWCHLIHDPQH